MRLALLLIFVPAAWARFCVDDLAGYCETNDLFGWCFHNKTSGRFDCDNDKFCASQPQLVGKAKSTGCFKRGDHTFCCCNDNDGCNYAFIEMPPRTNWTQKCENSNQLAGSEIAQLFKDCDDPWCYALMTTDDESKVTIRKGCQSRTLIKHFVFKKQFDQFNNNTRWYETQIHVEQPRCEELVGDIEIPENETSVTQCYDFFGKDDGKEVKGRLCCCRGGFQCNRVVPWQQPGVTMAEIVRRREARNSQGNASPPVPLTATITLLPVLVLGLFFLNDRDGPRK